MPLPSLIAALLDLVLPRVCAGCGRPGPPLCAGCRPGQPLRHVWAGGVDVWAAAEYEGVLRSALIAYKEHGRHDLLPALAELLARGIGAAGAVAGTVTGTVAGAASGVVTGVGSGVVLVPVPSAPAAARARGGDHVLRLARSVRRSHGLVVVPALSLARDVADSAGLSRADRAANLRGAMIARPPPGPQTALIVDDIVTTGATVREARRALTGAGWTVCGAATIASTPRPAAASAPLAGFDPSVYPGNDPTE